ncbi:MAG: hypothetical protein HKN87_19760 [Saprospiraceae bacterium]|nr:hypothetical protein [Saprospiraceae bacterium]
MKNIQRRLLLQLISLIAFICISKPLQSQSSQKLVEQSKEVLRKGITYFHSINIEGGYVYHYTLDLSEKWGEGKTDDYTVEVQPPGTPAVGASFLRAYRVLGDPEVLQAAVDAGKALIKGQNDLGGWTHTIRFNKPKDKYVSFDDDQTQRAISFLMDLDKEVDLPELTSAIEKALDMMLKSQLENGGWPHRYPANGSYHDFATFNDQGINDCIRVMLEAHQLYGEDDYLQSLHRVGRFLLISQLPPPQPGWAQQYNEYLQPAWARAFEPPAVCPSASIHNIHSLLDLYLYLGNSTYLEAIPDALRWLEDSQLPNGKWGRFLEIGTNKPLYYDRGRIRVNSIEELSLERRTGYGYENDLSQALVAATARFHQIAKTQPKEFPHEMSTTTSAEGEDLTPMVKEIIASLDEKGRWISFNDQFRKRIKGQRWNGIYRYEDRISSAIFNRNVDLLCGFIERQDGK